jgi:hypothetical protein
MIGISLGAVALAVMSPRTRAGENAVQLNVRAMAAPKPALKYQLLPEVRELNPGNPVQYYLRCFSEQRNFFFSKEAATMRSRYLSMPLAQLAAEDLRNYGGSALTQADWAARLDTPDWEVLRRVQSEGLDLLLPELDPLRILATALQVRFRGRVALQRYDEASRAAATMFALARHLGESPTRAANLVGLATANLALDTMEEMVQQPGCPNLYWALSDLPCPLVELRKGLQGHSSLVAAELRLLRDDSPMSEAQIDELVRHLAGAMGFAREQAGQSPRSFRSRLQARVMDVGRVRAARRRLVDTGSTRDLLKTSSTVQVILRRMAEAVNAEELVEKFPPAQVILLDEKRAYEIQRDERMKLLGLAPWQIDLQIAGMNPKCDSDCLFAEFLPPVIESRWAQGQLEQRIALLRYVEALRMFAAEHGGKLPLKLSDVSLPLPADPFTGKAFQYSVVGTTAHLRGRPARDDDKRGIIFAYDVTLQK